MTTRGTLRSVVVAAVAWAMAVGVAHAARVQRPVRAMWVRSQDEAFGARSGDILLAFCAAQRIELLFVAAPEPKPDTHDKWRRFLAQAHERGVQVHALAGEANWGLVQEATPAPKQPRAAPMLAMGRSLALRHLAQVLEYNGAVQPAERFDGIHHDIPVWTTGQYRAAQSNAERATLLANYVEQLWGGLHALRMLGSVAARSEGEPLQFGASIPAGLDEPTTWGKHGQFKEATLPASRQVIRTADYTAIMVRADTAEAILAAATEYVRFAGYMERRVFLGVSTGPEGDAGASASFGDDSRSAMEQVLGEVVARLQTEPGFAGVAIDDHTSCAAMRP